MVYDGKNIKADISLVNTNSVLDNSIDFKSATVKLTEIVQDELELEIKGENGLLLKIKFTKEGKVNATV